MSGVYLIRNPDSGKWLDCNSYECAEAEKSSRRFWSEKAARKCIRGMVATHKERNAYYADNPSKKWPNWEPYPEHYEVIAFKLVEVGSLG